MKTQIIQYPQIGNVIFKVTKSRNLRIAVKSNLQITVSFNKYCSLKKAREFFESRIIWVQNSLQKMVVKQEIHSSNAKINFPKLTAAEFLDRKHYLILRCKQLAEIYNFSIKKIVVRNQKTIWGSCSARNNISLNSNLVFLNSDLIDYVILHELVHTQVKNHSKRFWGRLEQVLPNCQLLNQQLRAFTPSSYKEFNYCFG
jgi:predicted metal-dependent hydrolase